MRAGIHARVCACCGQRLMNYVEKNLVYSPLTLSFLEHEHRFAAPSKAAEEEVPMPPPSAPPPDTYGSSSTMSSVWNMFSTAPTASHRVQQTARPPPAPAPPLREPYQQHQYAYAQGAAEASSRGDPSQDAWGVEEPELPPPEDEEGAPPPYGG